MAAIAVSGFFFALGSVCDFRAREVADKLWIAYGAVGAAVTIIRVFTDSTIIYLTLISIAITTLLSFGLFYFGLFGGADSKAIICLGVTIPLPPTILKPVIGYVHPIFPLVVVIVGFICSALVAVWFGLRNLINYLRSGSTMFEGLRHERRWNKLLAALAGYPADVSKLRSTFYLYPMEEITGDQDGAHRSLKLFFNAETDRDQAVSILSEGLSKIGYSGPVWVTPGLPMLIFILLGLIITLILGDPIFGSVLMLATH